jgi:3-dehydroquinate synthase
VVTIRVPLVEQRDASYEIRIGHGLLDDLAAALSDTCPARVYAVVTDSHVETPYATPLAARLRAAGMTVEVFAFAAGEWNKTRETWALLTDAMLARRLGRDSALLALGGGVVGDVAGFVAASYLRGIPYVQLPTTLLAMLDSSIGGKTGVDVAAGKNLVGAFHQPRLVVADLAVLESLPKVQLAAGLAEAVKHAVLGDADYFAFLEAERAAIRDRKPATLERLVARSVEIKRDVVALDEREAGPRALLNFGHTVAHAVEAVSQYGVLHGEAVAIGMVCEARLAERLGIAEPGTAARIAGLLEAFNLPLELPGSPDAVLDAMQHDKKVRSGQLRFALPRRVGEMYGDETQGWTLAVGEADIRAVLVNS